MGLLDGQTDKESWVDPETGLLFHNSQYNWNNTGPSIEKPTTEGFVVEPDRSLFSELAPIEIEEDSSGGLLEDALLELVEDNPSPEPVIAQETPVIEDYTVRRSDVNTGLDGINQFFHNVIDKEFSGGFMGFNPVNSMAHKAIGEHMKMYSDPDKITPDMIDNTRAMIIEKAGSKLGPQKTAYILERFNQYVLKILEYQKFKGGV
ncbi:MAG TPA: hypothetical protein EYN67_05970 [Flavobacteriales bacterium]|nr:hypothetical protein [Flavobacteriales bacterium]